MQVLHIPVLPWVIAVEVLITMSEHIVCKTCPTETQVNRRRDYMEKTIRTNYTAAAAAELGEEMPTVESRNQRQYSGRHYLSLLAI